MHLKGEKDSGKNNENSTAATLIIDTDFMFIFLYLKGFKN